MVFCDLNELRSQQYLHQIHFEGKEPKQKKIEGMQSSSPELRTIPWVALVRKGSELVKIISGVIVKHRGTDLKPRREV
jgi:hypothetical protein